MNIFRTITKTLISYGLILVAIVLPFSNAQSEASNGASKRQKADPEVRLKEFGETNPKCAMWTDWQRLCSRTGSGGSTYCRKDETYKVSSSAPFCAVATAFIPDTADQKASRNRFCIKYKRIWANQEEKVPTGPLQCVEYRSPRPFSGERITQMLHPLCTSWGTGEPGKTICRSSDSGNTPACTDEKILRLKSKSPFVCEAWSPTNICKKLVGGRVPATPAPDGDYIYYPQRTNTQPVWGTYCKD